VRATEAGLMRVRSPRAIVESVSRALEGISKEEASKEVYLEGGRLRSGKLKGTLRIL
jgi:hypothetical protein